MEGAGPNRFLIGEKLLGEVRRAETGRGCCTPSMFVTGSRAGRLRPMTVFSFMSCLPRTLALTWVERFDIGCPDGIYRRTNQQSNGYRLANLPPEFVEKKHALE
jgi:hypothetical protein